jgi:hypothetical protein
MSVGPENRDLLPVACTLGPADGTQRLAEWRRVTADAGAGRSIATGLVTLKFRDAPGIGAELRRLVAAERDCCAFLGWNVVQTAAEWRVEISGSDEELSSLPQVT